MIPSPITAIISAHLLLSRGLLRSNVKFSELEQLIEIQGSTIQTPNSNL